VTLSQSELQRVQVIENAAQGRLTEAEAAERLGLGQGQVKRLTRKHDEKRSEWVYHGNRVREPPLASMPVLLTLTCMRS